MKVFQITSNGLNEIEKKPDSNAAAIIVEEEKNRIWVWRGANAKPHEVYRAAASVSKIKTKFRLYKAKPIIVEEGREPKDFPKLG
ncbi:MAG: hypothetical protein ACTSYR_04205 [Candidatus Odinarchaeia archaeon]